MSIKKKSSMKIIDNINAISKKIVDSVLSVEFSGNVAKSVIHAVEVQPTKNKKGNKKMATRNRRSTSNRNNNNNTSNRNRTNSTNTSSRRDVSNNVQDPGYRKMLADMNRFAADHNILRQTFRSRVERRHGSVSIWPRLTSSQRRALATKVTR